MAVESWISNDHALQQAVDHLRAGRQTDARRLAEQVVQTDPRSERGWLCLADAVKTIEERRYCLSRVLSLNHRNAHARRELAILGKGAMRSPLDRLAHLRTPTGLTRLDLQWILRSHPGVTAVLYLVVMTLTEFLTLLVNPRIGLWGHSILLALIIVHSSIVWGEPTYKLLLTLAFGPMIRLVSLTMPLARFDIIYWYLVTSIPLLVAAFMIAWIVGYQRQEIGLTAGRYGPQLLIGATGLVFGYLEYLILRPAPQARSLALSDAFVPALILMVCTGFSEELIFRGIMQRAAEDAFGTSGWLYVAGIFAMMHMGHASWVDIPFVFAVSLFFSWLVSRTGSIFGVTLAHGVTNIVLFLILPLLSQTGGGGIPIL
jgi:membrane protease YdiL (CAAX protease family)